jgi:hypothetical protein
MIFSSHCINAINRSPFPCPLLCTNGFFSQDRANYPVGYTSYIETLKLTSQHNTQHTTHNTQHTTHNTQHTTHNTQHTTHINTTHNTQHTAHSTQHTTHNTQHTKHNTQHTTHTSYIKCYNPDGIKVTAAPISDAAHLPSPGTAYYRPRFACDRFCPLATNRTLVELIVSTNGKIEARLRRYPYRTPFFFNVHGIIESTTNNRPNRHLPQSYRPPASTTLVIE